MTEVKILCTTITHQYGTLSADDILRTSPEFAKHLVEDCHAAEYTKTKAEPVETAKEEPAKPPAKKAKG